MRTRPWGMDRTARFGVDDDAERVISPARPSTSRGPPDAPPTSASRARFNTEAFSPIPMVNMHEGVTVHHGQEGCPQDLQEGEEEGKEVVEEEVIRIVRMAST